MTTPFFESGDFMPAMDAALAQEEWYRNRWNNLANHWPSVGAGVGALVAVGAEYLEGHMATNVSVEGKFDLGNLDAQQSLGHVAITLAPSLSIETPPIPTGIYPWTTDAALQMSFSFRDRFNHRHPAGSQPTGNVTMNMAIRTWGELLYRDIDKISDAGGENRLTEVQYTEHVPGKKGTRVYTACLLGDTVSVDDASLMLRPLIPHVLNYFELTGNTERARYQTPGNFPPKGRLGLPS